MSCFIEQLPVSEDLFAEVITHGSFADDIDLCSEGLFESAVEATHLEQTRSLGCDNAEIVVAVGTVVPAGPGSEEIHPAHTVFGGDPADYPRKFLEGVFFSIHGVEMEFSLYKQGSETSGRSMVQPKTEWTGIIRSRVRTSHIKIT